MIFRCFTIIKNVDHFRIVNESIFNQAGVVPVVIIVIIAIISILGSGTIGFWLGKGNSFSIGLALGVGLVFLLPNLNRIIRWIKSVKGELESPINKEKMNGDQ